MKEKFFFLDNLIIINVISGSRSAVLSVDSVKTHKIFKMPQSSLLFSCYLFFLGEFIYSCKVVRRQCQLTPMECGRAKSWHGDFRLTL